MANRYWLLPAHQCCAVSYSDALDRDAWLHLQGMKMWSLVFDYTGEGECERAWRPTSSHRSDDILSSDLLNVSHGFAGSHTELLQLCGSHHPVPTEVPWDLTRHGSHFTEEETEAHTDDELHLPKWMWIRSSPCRVPGRRKASVSPMTP